MNIPPNFNFIYEPLDKFHSPSITPTPRTTLPFSHSHLTHSLILKTQKMVMMKKHTLFSLSILLMALCYTTTISAQTPAPSPSSAPTDIIRILKKAGGFTTLIRLLTTTQVSTQINAQLLNSNNGLTVFAPNDNAFQSLKPGFLNSLNDQQKNELIQFHVLPTFVSISNFDTLSNPVRTQAGDDPDRLALNITSSGNQVNLTTGVVNTTVGGSVYSDHQMAIYQVDKVLLPRDFFVPKPPPPAPAPAKAKASSAKKSADGPASAADNDSAAISLKLNNGMWMPLAVAAAAAVLSL